MERAIYVYLANPFLNNMIVDSLLARILVRPAVKRCIIINRPTIESICPRDAAVTSLSSSSPRFPLLLLVTKERYFCFVAGMVQIYISI